MKKLFGAIVAFALLAFNFNVQASDTQNPYALANEVATKTISDIKVNKDKLTDKAFANELIEKDLMPYIDSKYAAYKVMGTSLKTISAQDREKFTAAFTDYMKQNMVGVLTKYTNQDIVPSEVKDVDDKYQKKMRSNSSKYDETVKGADEKVNKRLKAARDKYKSVQNI